VRLASVPKLLLPILKALHTDELAEHNRSCTDGHVLELLARVATKNPLPF